MLDSIDVLYSCGQRPCHLRDALVWHMTNFVLQSEFRITCLRYDGQWAPSWRVSITQFSITVELQVLLMRLADCWDRVHGDCWSHLGLQTRLLIQDQFLTLGVDANRRAAGLDHWGSCSLVGNYYTVVHSLRRLDSNRWCTQICLHSRQSIWHYHRLLKLKLHFFGL